MTPAYKMDDDNNCVVNSGVGLAGFGDLPRCSS